MNKIIVLPGTADAIFFMNEVHYISKYFDEIIVISYPGNEKEFNRVAKQKGFRFYTVKSNVIRSLINIKFYKWLLCKDTLNEIKKVFPISKKSFLKLMYIFFYGLFYINANKFIDREIANNSDGSNYLYSFWLTRGAYTIAKYKKNRIKGITKILSRAHGYDLYEERSTTNYLPFRDFINNNLDEIHFISNHGRTYFENKYTKSDWQSKKYISRLGTFNLNNFQKVINKKDTICIASCSSIVPNKRLDLIIDVIANIDITVKWIHIGTGEQKEQLESYAKNSLKVIEYQFLGQIDNSDILKVYLENDVDYFINMSDSEGVPVSIMEAMSIGIPVIARNVGGNSEIVNNNTGLLLENINNMEAVFQKVNHEVRQRINDIDIYKSKSTESIKLWSLKYDCNKNYNQFFSGILNK